MQTRYRDRQFTAHFNRLMLATFGVVLLICGALLAVQAVNQARHDDAQLTERFRTRAIAIDNLVATVTEHLRLMQGQAQAHFLAPEAVPARLLEALAPAGDGHYALDRIPPPFTPADVGNLSGEGDPARLDGAARDELAMALALAPMFKGVQRNLPDAAWVYYTSARGFIHVYPWVPSSQARFTPAMFDKPFYRLGLPAQNPERGIRWTPMYVDLYGKGMMVTATLPVDRDGTFLGTVSIDLTLDELTAYVRDFKGSDGALMIVNASGQLIAHPTATSARDARPRALAEVLPEALRPLAGRLFEGKPLTPVERAGHQLLWTPMTQAPWTIVHVAEAPSLLMTLFSRAGLVFLVLLGGLTALLVAMRRVTFREFIHPAEGLVRHIFLESENRAVPVGHVPAPWRPWFDEVGKAFAQNRRLVEEINLKNQQLTDLNLSLERYTPKFILLVGLQPGCGAMTLGHWVADTLARKDAAKGTVFMTFPQPGRVAEALGLDPAVPVHRHPNGYDLWTSYELGQVPEAGVTSLLMAKVLPRYPHVVVCATVQEPAEAFVDTFLEPMFRYAKAIVLVVPPGGADGAPVRQALRQIKRSVRQDRTLVCVLANGSTEGTGDDAAADFQIPPLGDAAHIAPQGYAVPKAAAQVIGRLVDRVERVHQIAAFIPTTAGVDRPVDTSAYVERTITYFSRTFGGATSSQAQGAWASENAGIVSEVVHIVVSYTTEEDLSMHVDDVIDFVKVIKAELGQEAMAIEINQKLMLV